MRIFPILLVLFAFPAVAQVTVDMNALDALKKSAPGGSGDTVVKPAPPKPKAAKPKVAQPALVETARPADADASAPAASASAGGKAAVAKAPPGFHAPLPALLAPTNKPATPPPAVAPTAAGTGSAAPGGLRITFGNGQGEMSPASEQSLRALVAKASKSETVSYNVLAYAPGTPEDPSTARRLSLARGLAVRSVLMSAGVPSTRIYVRALGANDASIPGNANAPADRADVSILGANAPPPDLALPPVLNTVPSETSTIRPGAVKTP